jgi:hypothetical protein
MRVVWMVVSLVMVVVASMAVNLADCWETYLVEDLVESKVAMLVDFSVVQMAVK